MQALIDLRSAKEKEIKRCERLLKTLIEEHRQADDAVLRMCEHEWQFDEEQILGPYDRRDRVCKKCNSRCITPGR